MMHIKLTRVLACLAFLLYIAGVAFIIYVAFTLDCPK
jgi:hypothetical protein